MSDTYSFVFDRQAAGEVFKQIGKHELVLAMLATLTPDSHWDDCLIYEGESPMEEVRTVCVGIQGPAAAEVQERLIEKFEKQGVPVLQVYEGGPEVREPIARAKAGKWVTATNPN